MDHIRKKVDDLVRNRLDNSSDIMEHLTTLRRYAETCDSVLETGVRGCISSWAFCLGLLDNQRDRPKELFMNDISPCEIQEILAVTDQFDNFKLRYQWINNLDLILDRTYDIVFIDTWHVYGQLKRELSKFHLVANKFIILHDTTVDEYNGEFLRLEDLSMLQQRSVETGFSVNEITCGLWPAVEEFIAAHPEWHVKERFTNNNGLTILAKR